MLTMKPSDNDRAESRPRTGHGAASVIPRLNEQISRPEALPPEEVAEEPLARETPRPETPAVSPKPAQP